VQGSELQSIDRIGVIVIAAQHSCGACLPFFLEFRKLFRDSIASSKETIQGPMSSYIRLDPNPSLQFESEKARLIPKAYLLPRSSAVLSERVHGTRPSIARLFPAERFPRLGIRCGSPVLEGASPLCFIHIYHEALPFTVGAFLVSSQRYPILKSWPNLTQSLRPSHCKCFLYLASLFPVPYFAMVHQSFPSWLKTTT
jgi:hypothetical protein